MAYQSHGLKRYSYQYDAMGRLKNGVYSEPNASIPENNYYNEVLTYDLNGNVKTLKRNRNAQYIGVQLMDDLTYSYTGNKLDTVTDGSENYFGYPDTSGNLITYDDNVNMKSQIDKGILQIDYNYLNLPNYLRFNKALATRTGIINENTYYTYRSDGIKLAKIYNYAPYNPLGTITQLSSKITEYLDSFQYETLTGKKGTGALTLQFVPTKEGYYDFVQNKYFYQYKDQVGNVRLAYYKDASGNVVVDRTTDYYPFGLEFGGDGLNILGSLSPTYLYSFQEQEKQQETGWSSFKWRNYDPTYVRFFNIDPLAEKYAYQSPFNFSENAVVAHRELEGLEKQHVFYTPFGTLIYTSGAGGHYTGEGVTQQLTRATNNSLRFWGGLIGSSSLAIGAKELTKRVLNSEGDSKAKSGKSDDKGATKTGTKGGDRAGKKFTEKGKQKVIEDNKVENEGKTVCADCGTETTPAKKRERGGTIEKDETQVDHIYPKSEGGDGSPSNGQVLCQGCNNTKSNQLPEDYYKPKN
jgi:RHS repeat-associated protein